MCLPFHPVALRAIWFSAAFCLFVALVGGAGNVNATDVATISTRLLERQKNVRTASFTWRELKSYPKDSIVDPDAELKGPAQDETVENTVRLLLDSTIGGGRYEFTGKSWSFIESRFASQHYESVVNGGIGKTYWAPGIKHGNGTITNVAAGQWTDGSLAPLTPVMWTFRAQDPVFARFNPAEWEVSSVGKDAEGRQTIVLATKAKTALKQLLTFIDDGTFPLVRIERQSKGKTTSVVEIKNVVDSSAGWVPHTWKSSFIKSDGTLGISTMAEMISYEINPTMPATAFDIEYPVGTEVNDGVRGEHYLIHPNGARGPVRLNPDGTLMYPPESPWSYFGKWIAGILLCSVLIVVLGLLVARRSRLVTP